MTQELPLAPPVVGYRLNGIERVYGCEIRRNRSVAR